MSYLGKNINMTLLLLVVGVVVVLIGITIFFQTGLKTRTGDFEEASTNLTECTTQVKNYQERLSEEEEKATSAAQDIRRYDQLYETKVAEIEDTKDDLSAAQKQIQLKELRITSLEAEKAGLQQTVNTRNQEINTLNDKISSLNDDIDNLEVQLSACEALIP